MQNTTFAQKYFNRKMLSILLLGFSSGIPFSLTASTLQAWMMNEKVDLATIGAFSMVGLPYGLRFLWAPFLDRFIPPFLGKRRGWILISQISLVICITLFAFCKPGESLIALAIIAFLTAFSSASHDIVGDAYKTELLEPSEFGMGSASGMLGYRMAMLVSGAGALILSDIFPWKIVYLIMAVLMLIGILTTIFLAPNPSTDIPGPESMKAAIVDPFLDLFKRKGALEIILFIFIFKLDNVLVQALTTPFVLSMGFTKTEMGTVANTVGLIATPLSAILGGIWITRLGIHKSLWIFGILQTLNGFGFYLLAQAGHSFPVMIASMAWENFFSSIGTTSYMAFVMLLCNPKFTATQFALLSGLMAITRVVGQAPTGWLVKNVGWENYYLITLALAIPGYILLLRYPKWIEKKV